MTHFRLTFTVLTAALFFPAFGHAGIPSREQLIDQEIAMEDSGDLVGAIEINKQILLQNPKDASAMNVIAGLYGKLGNFDQEIIWARKAIAINKKLHLAYVNYGNAQSYLGHVIEAQAAFETASKIAPLDPLPVYSLGVLSENKKNLSEAITYYEKSVALDSKFESGLFSLAAMYANAKRYIDAVAMLNKLLVLNPNADDAKAMLQQIQEESKAVKH